MPSVEESACPDCGGQGTLSLTDTLTAKPLGSFSLAGAQLKVSAVGRPVVSCSTCPLELVGRYEGRHAVFPRPGPPNPDRTGSAAQRDS